MSAKMNVDDAIGVLQDYIKLDREIRKEDNDDCDYSLFCENKCIAMESLIEYIYASRCAFKPSNEELKESILNTLNKEIEDLQRYAKNDDMYYHGLIAGIYFSEKIIDDLWK